MKRPSALLFFVVLSFSVVSSFGGAGRGPGRVTDLPLVRLLVVFTRINNPVRGYYYLFEITQRTVILNETEGKTRGMVDVLTPGTADSDERLGVSARTPATTLGQGLVTTPALSSEPLPLEDPVVGSPLLLLEAGVPECRPAPNGEIFTALLMHDHVAGRALYLEALVPLAPAVLVGGGERAHGTALVVVPVVCTIDCPLHPFGHVGGGPARLAGPGCAAPPLLIPTRDLPVHSHVTLHILQHGGLVSF